MKKEFPVDDFTLSDVAQFLSCSYQQTQRTVRLLLNGGDVQNLFSEKTGKKHFHFIHEDREKSVLLLGFAHGAPRKYIESRKGQPGSKWTDNVGYVHTTEGRHG